MFIIILCSKICESGIARDLNKLPYWRGFYLRIYNCTVLLPQVLWNFYVTIYHYKQIPFSQVLLVKGIYASWKVGRFGVPHSGFTGRVMEHLKIGIHGNINRYRTLPFNTKSPLGCNCVRWIITMIPKTTIFIFLAPLYLKNKFSSIVLLLMI